MGYFYQLGTCNVFGGWVHPEQRGQGSCNNRLKNFKQIKIENSEDRITNKSLFLLLVSTWKIQNAKKKLSAYRAKGTPHEEASELKPA